MRPMHGDDATDSLRTHVRSLSPNEAADVLAGAWDTVQRRRLRVRLALGMLGALVLAIILGFSLR